MKRVLKFAACIFISGIFHFSCQKKFLCPDCEINKPPIANAGPDQIIVLPKDSTVLDGNNSSDSDGQLVSYKWIMISGPFISNITKNDSARTSVKGLVIGIYQFELLVTDNKGASGKDTVQIMMNPGNGNNQLPVSNAGIDQTITLPIDSVFLNGNSSVDPDGTIASWQWIKISGPSSSNILNSQTSITIAKSLTEGIYQFELKVTDNVGAIGKDTVQVTVNKGSSINHTPVACAGADQVITLPTNSVNLNGSCSTDPENNITGYVWTKISGPSSFNIGNANAIQTSVTNLTEGTYLYEVKVTDAGALFSKDTMKVTVIPAVTVIACDNSNRPEVTARLIPIGTLSKPRSGMALAAAGNKIVFAGGIWTADCPECWGSPRVDIYDIGTNTWSTSELSTGRWSIGAVAAGNKMFFAGGQFGDGAFDTYYDNVDIYDALTNTWTVKHLSETRGFIAAGAVGNKVIFAGGEKNVNYETSAVVDVYNLSTDTWSATQLSEARGGISAVTVKDQLYFAGGEADHRWYTSPSNKIDIYNNSTNSWSTSTLSNPMHLLTGITMADKIYWAAGCTVEIKDVASWSSSIAHPYTTTSWDIRSVAKDNFILILGGYRGSVSFPSVEKKFDIYNTTTKTWSIGVLPVAIESAISYNNIIYATDGVKVYKLEF
jgi:hypothetical protein